MHLDHDEQGHPWPGKDTELYRTVLPEHLRALKQFRQVTGTVIVEASPWVEDNQWLLDLAKDDKFIVGIVGNLKLGEPDFAKLLKRIARNPLFRGIRANVALVKQLIDKNEMADFEQLANLDLSLDAVEMCYTSMNSSHVEGAQRCSNTTEGTRLLRQVRI